MKIIQHYQAKNVEFIEINTPLVSELLTNQDEHQSKRSDAMRPLKIAHKSQ